MKLISSFFICILITACGDSKNSDGKLVAPPVSSDAGGISSGGGGTLPDRYISPASVQKIIWDAKRDLRTFFNFKLWAYDQEDSYKTYGAKLFQANKINILDILESTDIEVLTDKPCKDRNGKDVDGSIYSAKPNAICISAFTTSKKLLKERARIEILGLIAHELSHLLGTTEEEAFEFQRVAVLSFDSGSELTVEEHLDRLLEGLSLMNSFFNKIKRNENIYEYGEIYKLLSKVSFTKYEYERGFLDIPYAYSSMGKTEHDFEMVVEAKMLLLTWYAQSLSNGRDSENALKKYNKTFEGRDKITYLDFAKKHWEFDIDNTSSDFVISVIKTKEDFFGQLEEIRRFYSLLHDYAQNIKRGDPLFDIVKLYKKERVNPWYDNFGEYMVTNVNCKYDGYSSSELEPTSFAIEASLSLGNPVLLIIHESPGLYLKSKKYLFDRARDFAGGEVSVFQKGKSSVRLGERGNMWGRSWNSEEYNLTKYSSGDYALIKKVKNKGFYDGGKISSKECTYNLIKTGVSND